MASSTPPTPASRRAAVAIATLAPLACGLLVCGLPAALCAVPAPVIRVWVQLPTAQAPAAEVADLPYAPLPGPKALARRVARGDAARLQYFTTGPDPGALALACEGATRVRHVSRWLSAVSLETTADQVASLLRAFGPDALRPVRTLRAPLPQTQWPFESPLPAPNGSVQPSPKPANPAGVAKLLDYGAAAAQLAQIQVDQLHAEGLSGRGITVLVLDTGFRIGHSVFAEMDIAGEHDFVFDDPVTANEAEDVTNQDSHGTGVLSVVGGHAPGQLIGPAYAATYLLAKTEALGSETRLEEDHFVAALEWGEALGADIATASLSYLGFDDGFTYPLSDLDGDTGVTTRAMDAAAALGVLPVCAMGNRGSAGASSLGTPADADSAVSVGAVDSTGALATFSSRGPSGDGRVKPDVCARGVLVHWAVAHGGYGDASGTSLAAPLVAGAAALVLEARPEWTAQQVADALRETATRSATPDNDFGHGIVQARDAAFELSPPQWPLPFVEVLPADGATGGASPTTFAWRRARDLQDPGGITYVLHAATSAAFADTLAMVSAGSDSFRVLSAFPAPTFSWRVLARDPQGHLRASPGRVFHAPAAVTTPPGRSRVAWASLRPPHPNPFNPRVSLTVVLERPARAELWIHDAAGRRVRPLRQGGGWSAGVHRLEWDGTDAQGAPVASGVYLVRLRATDGAGQIADRTVRVTLVR